jgi:hypothetical protein
MAPEPGDYRVAIDTLNNFSDRKMFLANSSLSFSLPVFRFASTFVGRKPRQMAGFGTGTRA